MSMDDYQTYCEEYLDPFHRIFHIYDDDRGFIVWRYATGKNIELLHIKTFEKRKGYGKDLFIRMLKMINDQFEHPYHSIFGFTRVKNKEAKMFYKALGFKIHKVKGVYQDKKCKIFEAPFKKLLKKHGIEIKQ